MVWAFDLADAQPGFATRAYQTALHQGVLLRPIGNTVYLMPPYVVGEDEMAKMAGAAMALLTEVN